MHAVFGISDCLCIYSNMYVCVCFLMNRWHRSEKDEVCSGSRAHCDVTCFRQHFDVCQSVVTCLQRWFESYRWTGFRKLHQAWLHSLVASISIGTDRSRDVMNDVVVQQAVETVDDYLRLFGVQFIEKTQRRSTLLPMPVSFQLLHLLSSYLLLHVPASYMLPRLRVFRGYP